jgi:chitosanase
VRQLWTLRILLALAALPAAGCSGTDDAAIDTAGEAVRASHAAWLAGDAKRRAAELTSLFENGTIELQYAYVEDLHDGRGYTAGRAGFTTATGDALEVVQRYTSRVSENPLARFLPRLRQLARAESGSTTGLSGFATAWQQAARDPAFRQAQDDVEDELYFAPAMTKSDALHLALPLSRAAVWDAIIQHGDGDDPDGLDALLARTRAAAHGTPATGVDEKTWLDAFFTVRRADLAHASDPDTRAAWAESVSRVDALRSVARAGDYALDGPVHVVSSDFDATIP